MLDPHTLVLALLVLGLVGLDRRTSEPYNETKEGFKICGCGFWSIPRVLSGKSRNPMQHRPMVPWLVGLFPVKSYQSAYLAIKSIGFAAMTYISNYYLGFVPSLILLCVMAAAIWYDYPDTSYEVGLVYLFLLGAPSGLHFGWLVAACVFWSLMRESAIYGPIILAASGLWYAALLTVIAYALARLLLVAMYGMPENYMTYRFGTAYPWRLNIGDLLTEWENASFASTVTGPLFFSFVLVGVCAYVALRSPIAFAVPILAVIGAGAIRAKWCETRVFLPAAAIAIAAGVRAGWL